MDTSIQARWITLGLLFAGVLIIAFANLRLVAFLLLKRRVSRAAKIIWPALGTLVAGCIYDAVRIEPNWIQVTHHTIRTPKLASGARIRIAHISDIHLVTLSVREIQMLNRTAQEHPDLIVMTGDHTVSKTADSMLHLKQIAARFARLAPTYAIEGNWDVPLDMIALRQGGVKVLADRAIAASADGRARVGLRQVWWNARSVQPVPREDSARYNVLLCHRPELFDQASRAGYDLMLSGHTHGGQVRMPVFGALIPHRSLVGRYQAGMYEKNGSRLYVSRGIGLESRPAPQMRFLCRPEIAIIDIVGTKR